MTTKENIPLTEMIDKINEAVREYNLKTHKDPERVRNIKEVNQQLAELVRIKGNPDTIRALKWFLFLEETL